MYPTILIIYVERYPTWESLIVWAVFSCLPTALSSSRSAHSSQLALAISQPNETRSPNESQNQPTISHRIISKKREPASADYT
mmetsp:Transcript_21579/g.45631  ORF Transcript_21579/g.45631 Transcript_21579/m.45631 type:complete len:83 (-) Transcript_21579:1044-1292(-)